MFWRVLWPFAVKIEVDNVLSASFLLHIKFTCSICPLGMKLIDLGSQLSVECWSRKIWKFVGCSSLKLLFIVVSLIRSSTIISSHCWILMCHLMFYEWYNMAMKSCLVTHHGRRLYLLIELHQRHSCRWTRWIQTFGYSLIILTHNNFILQ